MRAGSCIIPGVAANTPTIHAAYPKWIASMGTNRASIKKDTLNASPDPFTAHNLVRNTTPPPL
jgi:hypothetical protein